MRQPMHEVIEPRNHLLKKYYKNKNAREIDRWTFFCFFYFWNKLPTGFQWCQFFFKISLSSWDLQRLLKQNYLSKLIWAQAKVCYLLMRKPADGDCHFGRKKFRGYSKLGTDSNTDHLLYWWLLLLIAGTKYLKEQLKGRGVCFSL